MLSTLSIAITAYPDPSGIQNKLAFGREEVVPIDEDQWKRIENGTWIFEDNIGQFRVSIDAGIVIINATEDRIEGKVVDSNGNLLDMYDLESVIMATFGYDSKRNTQTYTTIPQQGTFAIEIPEEYSDADYVKLWVNGNTYTIKAPKLPLPEKEYFSTTKDIIEQSNGTASAEIAIANATYVTTTSQNGNNTTILKSANLSHLRTEHATFRYVDLRHADLSHARLWGAEFVLANLSGARLSNADLRMAQIYRSNLNDADLTNVDFRFGALVKTSFQNTKFDNVVFEKYAFSLELDGLADEQKKSIKFTSTSD